MVKKISVIILSGIMMIMIMASCANDGNKIRNTSWYIENSGITVEFGDDTFIYYDDDGDEEHGEYVYHEGEEAYQLAEISEEAAREEMNNYEDEFVALEITLEDGRGGLVVGFKGPDSATMVIDKMMVIYASKL